MKKFIVVAVLMLASPAFALSLKWDAVTTDTSGAPLPTSLVVTQYKIYKCNTPASSCTKAQATVIGTVNAPTTTFTLNGQTFPASYFVTAVNIVEESPESGTVKVVPPDKPKNERVENP